MTTKLWFRANRAESTTRDARPSKRWFRAKRYGWGWTPCSWEGWFVLVIFVVFEWWNFARLDTASHSASDTLRPYLIQSLIAVATLIAVAYWKGEKPRWRWGD